MKRALRTIGLFAVTLMASPPAKAECNPASDCGFVVISCGLFGAPGSCSLALYTGTMLNLLPSFGGNSCLSCDGGGNDYYWYIEMECCGSQQWYLGWGCCSV
jgi:hypothetical protein